MVIKELSGDQHLRKVRGKKEKQVVQAQEKWPTSWRGLEDMGPFVERSMNSGKEILSSKLDQ